MKTEGPGLGARGPQAIFLDRKEESKSAVLEENLSVKENAIAPAAESGRLADFGEVYCS